MLSNVTKIILHSGLGNQLFQWAYGHFLYQKGYSVEYVKIRKQSQIQHANIDLRNLVQNCSHGQFKYSSPMGIHGLFERGLFRNIFTRETGYLDYRDQPFLAPSEFIRQPSVIIGYFQSMDLIDSIKKEIIGELTSAVNSHQLDGSFNDCNESYSVIHFRRSDTKSSENMRRIGLLDTRFYARVLSKSKYKNFVITDDLGEANKMFTGNLRVAKIFANSHLTEFQTLKLMMNAKQVFCANSTFSWWGALLALEKGATVFLPEPFYISAELGNKLSYLYQGFQSLPSTFVQT